MQPISTLRLAVFGLLLAWVAPAASQQVIRVGGTGTATPIIERLAEQYRKVQPDIRIDIVNPPLGSGGGYRALAAGAIQIALGGRPPDAAEQANFGDTVAWVHSPLVLAGRDLPQGFSLSPAQIADIYAGRMRQWPDGHPIRLVLRSLQESDTQLLRRIAPAIDAAVTQAHLRPGLPVAQNDLDNLLLLERTPGSLGTASLNLLRATGSKLRPIAIDGVAPNGKMLAQGRYPWSRTLYLAIGKTPDAPTRQFVAFLRSPAALDLLARLDSVPAAQ